MNAAVNIEAGDLRVTHTLEGPVGAPFVMLAHGIMTSHRMWDDVAEVLARRWRVLRYDLRGHGGTTVAEAPYRMAQLADDAVALLDALEVERTHFIGSSLGGMIGQQLGARHGGRFETLTLANTSAVQGTAQAWSDRIAIAAEKGMAPLVEPTLQRWFTESLFARDPARVDKMRQLACATAVTGFIGCATAIRDLSQMHLLAEIRLPTLIVAGEHDRATPLAESQVLHQGIVGSQLVIFPAAHQCAVERPGDFVAAWQAFAEDQQGNNNELRARSPRFPTQETT